MVACGTLALTISGGVTLGLAFVFALLLIAAWTLEESRWQLSERIGLVVVILSLPIFYLDWKFQTVVVFGADQARSGITALTHFILFLSIIKLWQIKADRDWLFLYLISFFEILLAAGLSISPYFLVTLGLYMFCALSTIVCFEIRRARRQLQHQETRLLVAPDSDLLKRLAKHRRRTRRLSGDARRLPLVALSLLVLIFALALPIFFITPRFGGGGALARSDGGITNMVGFSDQVSIGEIGQLQKSDRVVMHVRVDDAHAEHKRTLVWRGVALDNFNGRAWRRSNREEEFKTGGERNLFQVGTTEALERLTMQTFFMEPMDTPVLFIAPRPIAIQGALPFVGRDSEEGLTTREHALERLTYRAYSDTNEPPVERLRADHIPYPEDKTRYLQLPTDIDPRIVNLTRELIVGARANNRYDAARAVEQYLKTDFGYTLDMKAGGADPLADFLFRVRAGHCEYFSTAMAVMLRTAGIATRVVNGFQAGEYNDAADAYTVRQSDAHSWVEVYFPQNGAWVTFDPTPYEQETATVARQGLRGRLSKYAEALELFWIQYVVAYDKQEQRSLATTVRGQLGVYRQTAAQIFEEWRAGLSAWWSKRQPSESNSNNRRSFMYVPVLIYIVIFVAVLLLAIRGWRWLQLRRARTKVVPTETHSSTAINFYNRMSRALETRGLRRAQDQTPLEFATTTGMPEALLVTRAYNRVRFGAQDLSTAETARLEAWLRKIEESKL